MFFFFHDFSRHFSLYHRADVFLSTILDCLEKEDQKTNESEEDFISYEREKKEIKEKETRASSSSSCSSSAILPLSVISAAIGEITAKDIMIAGSANGKWLKEWDREG